MAALGLRIGTALSNCGAKLHLVDKRASTFYWEIRIMVQC